jgi:hypothetical protein
VLRVLRWATRGAGVVVILEDLHWPDDATLAVARYLADRADEVPAALLAPPRASPRRRSPLRCTAARPRRWWSTTVTASPSGTP